MGDELRQIFDFIAFSARLREVERHNNATPKRKESVAEHSWHLALVCWVLHREFERECGHTLDLEKMLKMCLMHDLVEIEAGDPSAWRTQDSTRRREEKARVEEEVAQRRYGALPGELGAEFLAVWREHEEGVTPEARLVRGAGPAPAAPAAGERDPHRPVRGGQGRRGRPGAAQASVRSLRSTALRWLNVSIEYRPW
ncbi:HD domain-containing protein [Streptoverticillium reticulum]|uniref:HD domain-containing protein n=1 Tax=Streptoverticillium reticulum TaxID=1433415 RepID=UPI0039BF54D0